MSATPDFIRTRVIAVEQSLGTFYVASIAVEKLLEVCFTERLHAERFRDGYRLAGTQRELDKERLREIAQFIDTPEYAFPNTIILSANDSFRESEEDLDTDIPDDEKAEVLWTIEAGENEELYLVVPKASLSAAVIDGQHRLFAYSYARKEKLADKLACSIYFDLPSPVQAFLFATINSKQKPVDKSQTYDLFGYNIGDEPELRWSPEKLAVFLTRRLNIDEDSALKGRIIIAASNEIVESRARAKLSGRWMVSMATIVRGISAAVSQNPERIALWLRSNPASVRSEIPIHNRVPPPLFDYYKLGNDELIYKILKNFLKIAEEILWSRASSRSRITRTIGIQALFDLFRDLCVVGREHKTLTTEFFREKLARTRSIDFSDNFFEASGRGRNRIRNTLLIATGLITLEKVQDSPDAAEYERILCDGITNDLSSPN